MLENILLRIEAENEENPLWIVGPKTGHFLYWLLRVVQPEHAVELGTSVGYSALWMASALEENKKGKLWTVESHAERFERAQKNIAESGLVHRIEQIKHHAPEVFEDPKIDLPRELDFAFLDATKHQQQSFFDALLPRMSPGAMIVVDNVQSHRFGEMEKFIHGVHKNSAVQVAEIPVGAGLLIARVL